MSLYYETATIISRSPADAAGGSLKSRVYATKGLKSSAPQVYALATETTKWSIVLKEVVERSGVLAVERKVGYLWTSQCTFSNCLGLRPSSCSAVGIEVLRGA
jgi:hypothetical protein